MLTWPQDDAQAAEVARISKAHEDGHITGAECQQEIERVRAVAKAQGS